MESFDPRRLCPAATASLSSWRDPEVPNSVRSRAARTDACRDWWCVDRESLLRAPSAERHATHADLPRREGRREEAAEAYTTMVAMVPGKAESDYLASWARSLSPTPRW